MIKVCRLCGLHVPTDFGKAAGDGRGWGTLVGFGKAAGKCLDCVHLRVSGMQQENALSVHAGWL